MKKVLRRISLETCLPEHSIHGIAHSQRVAEYGRIIAEHEDVSECIITLFAYFHDCQRLSDGIDPEHGLRAAEYIGTFSGDELELDAADIERLVFACRHHTYEQATDDKTIRACWDADRLDLGRAGITPDPNRLFTETAKRIAMGDQF